MIGLAARLLRHRAGPAAATLLALVAGVLILVAMGTLVESGLRFRAEPRLWAAADVVVANRTVSHTFKEFGETTTSTVALPEGGTVDAAVVDRIRQVPGVAAVAGDDAVLIGSPAAVGHGWDTYAFTGRRIAAGAAPQADDEVLLDTRLGVAPGDRIDLVVGGVSRSYRVSGTADTGSAAVFFTDAQAARLSAHPGRVDAIGVRMVPGADLGAVREIASAAGATTYVGKDRGKVEQSENQAAQTLLIEAGSAFGVYVVLLIISVVAGTIGLSVRHRRRDLALLRAVAATPGQVRRMLIAEAALLALVGSAIGGPAGLLAARWVHGELVERGFVPASFPRADGLFAVPAAVGTAVLVAVLAALVAARRVTGIKPIEALGEIAVEPRRSGRVRLIAGVLTLAAAGTSGAFTLGAAGSTGALAGAIGMLYLFVIAVALLAPKINAYAARLLTPLLPRVWRISGYLAAANLRANAQGMATVLTALVLSVGFGGSVWFLQTNLERQTTTQSSAGTLAERVVVAPGGLPADAAREIRELTGVQAATGVRRTQVVVRALGGIEPVGAQSVDPAGITSTMDLAVREGNLADLRAGTVAVSAMQASSSGWEVGDQAELWLGDGTPVTLDVIAIYGRGLGFGDVTLAAETVAGHTAGNTTDEVLVSAGPEADTALATWSAGQPGTEVLDAATRTRLISTDLALGAWLNRLLIGVMVGYAALAAATTMVMAALARRRELALLQLVGVTRRQIRAMVQAEQAGLLGAAVLIGATIAALTLSAIVNGLTGSPIPYVPPLGWVAVLGGTTLLALATTVWPVRRLLNAPPIDNIGVKE
ncbi:FtsX-like permease family protein [Micromonospora sp. NPDC005171]|uniref:ABC transporter permease n=1 Tax=Micromonospora sp. NPDC005171 TaxID=3156866 RepID=UPI0033A58515